MSENSTRPRGRKNSRGAKLASRVAMVGIMAGTVECAKLALAAVPNVEAVTLLLSVYGYTFGGLGVMAAVVFVCIEPLIWGFGTWIFTYMLYWPALALLFAVLGRLRVRSRVLLSCVAVAMTLWFGVLSSLIDVGLLSGYFDNFFYRFGIYYARGVWFYITQIACNAIVIPLLLLPLSDRLAVFR